MENGTIINQYKIISPIGKGGMGEVYLAEDTRLDRKVALKILPPEFAGNKDRMNRFVREAKSASALNHPNIITIHEIGASEGTHYIATEFIEGETLRDRLKDENLSLKSALDIAVQIVSALQAAHSAKIIHRDIKPDNVMIRADGLVKILDFGIAKLSEQKIESIDEEAATAIKPPSTNPGMIIGTANYMSPEQARGKEVDARSDIFSFGIVLYEMLSGRQAFAGENALDAIGAILHKEPAPLSQILPALPREIERIVNKSLRKDREERYQTARGLLTDLKDARQELEFQDKLERASAPYRDEPTMQMTGAAPTRDVRHTTSSAEFITGEVKKHKFGAALASLILLTSIGVGVWFFYLRPSTGNAPIDSIAVLPFENKSGNPDSEYLSDGLAESLIYRLSQLPDLKVSPTSSVFRYKGRETDARKIGIELGVNAVMTGRITQRGEQLTISVELIDVRNNKLIWGEQYERKLSELLATQREIAATITQKLQLKLSGGEKALTKKYTDSSEAYQLYLKARFHFAKRTKEDILRSIELFREAIKVDPNFALAYVGVAESYAVMPSYPYMSPAEAMPQSKAAVAKALELDPELAEAHTVAGMNAALYDWNWAEAEREFKKAIELDPNLAITHYRYAWVYLSPLGRHAEAVAEMKRAMELEPLALTQGANYAAVLMYARQFDLALEQARKTYDLDPNHVTGRSWMCHTLNAKGMYSESLLISEKTLQTDSPMLPHAAYAYAKSGQRRRAEELIKRWKEGEKTRYVMSYWSAVAYAALGEREAAFAELEKAYRNRDWFLQRLKVDPFMDPLRGDPRFKEMLKRLNLPE